MLDPRISKVIAREADRQLSTIELIASENKNGVPGETRSFVETSGVRIGVAAETTRGHDAQWFQALAARMITILRNQ